MYLRLLIYHAGKPLPLDGVGITLDANGNASKSQELKGFYSTVTLSSGDTDKQVTFQP
jgi:hypothetical protein